MTLDELESKLNKAKSAKEFFGKHPETSFRTLVRVCHPDRNPGDKKAEEVFRRLHDFYESLDSPDIVIRSRKNAYKILKIFKAGDISDIHFAQSSDKEYLLKISRIIGADVFLENENKILTELHKRAKGTTYDKYFPVLVESFPARDKIQKRINVFEYQGCNLYSVEDLHEKIPYVDGKHLAWMFNRLMVGLGFAHQIGYVHGAVLPSHVSFDVESHGISLTSWGHSVPVNGIVTTISNKYKEWYAPEILEKKFATPATDIYHAAKIMLYLAGVDPNKPFKLDSKQVPMKMQRFFKSCLLPGLSMRPNDAWKLHDEFNVMLKELYGGHKFHHFHVPE